jgi:PHP family Zn ribbon phosphoesterase
LAADGRLVGSETACLALATPLDLTESVELVHSVGGLAIAAHVDRKSFSVFSQLGFFPKDARFDGVELSRHLRPGFPRVEELEALGLPITSSSDSHFPEEIGTVATELLVEEPTFAELALAFAGADGRAVGSWRLGGSVSGREAGEAHA